MTTSTAPVTLPAPFRYRQVEVDGTSINTAVAGNGEPLLLLHGYPQNHLIWRHIAPALAERFTVVATDLRGYGDSAKPPPDDAHRVYSKRAMADDQLGVMRELGFDRFHVVGHDRGARVGHRLALDHPDTVDRLALLDIVPTRHVLTHAITPWPRHIFTGSWPPPVAVFRNGFSATSRSSGSAR